MTLEGENRPIEGAALSNPQEIPYGPDLFVDGFLPSGSVITGIDSLEGINNVFSQALIAREKLIRTVTGKSFILFHNKQPYTEELPFRNNLSKGSSPGHLLWRAMRQELFGGRKIEATVVIGGQAVSSCMESTDFVDVPVDKFELFTRTQLSSSTSGQAIGTVAGRHTVGIGRSTRAYGDFDRFQFLLTNRLVKRGFDEFAAEAAERSDDRMRVALSQVFHAGLPTLGKRR